MTLALIEDWSDAYENRAYTPDFDRFPARWAAESAAFRARLEAAGRARLGVAYGADPRQRLDLFLPEGAPQGLAVIIHGGYWRSLDARDFSHLAAGPVARGWAVALPAYRLAPVARIAEITADTGAAVEAAAGLVDGPIRIAGHSAGGHLAARMTTATTPLSAATARRVVHVLSVSGLHDLRPLLMTDKNADLRLDAAEASAESPALLVPLPGTRLTAWVGGDERPEFLRQSALLPNIWMGLGAATRSVVEPGRHHFDVIESFETQGGALTRALLET